MERMNEIAELLEGRTPERRKAHRMLQDVFREDPLEFEAMLRDLVDVGAPRKRLGSIVFQITGTILRSFITETDVFLPSLEEIAEACREIRDGWNREERKARWAIPAGWLPPKLHFCGRGQR